MNATDLTAFHQQLDAARREIASVIIGQEDVVNLALITILTGNHALIEGVPGVAKTLLVRTLAAVLAVETNRIQFTPDLMPSDITGTHVFNMKTQEFSLVKGPIFTTFLLADEINRAPAKTQSALLQAMQERRVTIDRTEIALDPSFTVFATQNPIEHEGTYALPQAQQDRFMVKITMDYPGRDDERRLAQSMLTDSAPEQVLASGSLRPVLEPGELAKARGTLAAITVSEELLDYMVGLVRRTREDEAVLFGAGPRATQSLLLGARAAAALAARDFVTPDDVKALAQPILGHRLMLRPEYEIEGLTVPEVIDRLLDSVPVPR
ncbi:MAG: MoxR family ATPase [Puniceicoccaceae bacterium]|nr:MAG: MoxR family ATPase [Puniceicoccaceae bacterium]